MMAAKYTITFVTDEGEKVVKNAQGNLSLMRIGEKAGLKFNSDCRAGQCKTCLGKI